MRVIAGQWKGRRLKAGRGQVLRPTTDRVKEAMFAILGPRVNGAEVLDLCCGAGSLGIEALSRGSVFVHFVDQSTVALGLVKANLTACRAEIDSFALVRSEAVTWSREYIGRRREERRIIVLADPPYASDLAHRIVQELARAPSDFNLDVAVIEHASEDDWQVLESDRWRWRRRSFGATTLTILEG